MTTPPRSPPPLSSAARKKQRSGETQEDEDQQEQERQQEVEEVEEEGTESEKEDDEQDQTPQMTTTNPLDTYPPEAIDDIMTDTLKAFNSLKYIVILGPPGAPVGEVCRRLTTDGRALVGASAACSCSSSTHLTTAVAAAAGTSSCPAFSKSRSHHSSSPIDLACSEKRGGDGSETCYNMKSQEPEKQNIQNKNKNKRKEKKPNHYYPSVPSSSMEEKEEEAEEEGYYHERSGQVKELEEIDWEYRHLYLTPDIRDADPESLVQALSKLVFERRGRYRFKNFLFEDFPRTVEQAVAFERVFGPPDHVIIIDMDKDSARSSFLSSSSFSSDREEKEQEMLFETRYGEFREHAPLLETRYTSRVARVDAAGTGKNEKKAFWEVYEEVKVAIRMLNEEVFGDVDVVDDD